MVFLSKIFNKTKTTKKNTHYHGEDGGCYISGDSKFGVFLEGSTEEVRRSIKEEIKEKLEKLGTSDLKGSIRRLLEEVNEKLNADGKELSGVVYYMQEKHVELLHIGLSRAYITRENEIMQLTEDDTQGWNLFKTGTFTEERLKESPLGKMLSKSLGKNKQVQINTSEYYFSPGEKLLIISGETAMEYGDEKLYDILGGSLDLAAEKLQGKSYLLKVFSS